VYQRRQTYHPLEEKEGWGAPAWGGAGEASLQWMHKEGLVDLDSEDARDFEDSENQEQQRHPGQAHPESSRRLRPEAPCATPASSDAAAERGGLQPGRKKESKTESYPSGFSPRPGRAFEPCLRARHPGSPLAHQRLRRGTRQLRGWCFRV